MQSPLVSWTNSDLIVLGDPAYPEVPSVIQFNDGTYGNSVLAGEDSAEVTFKITNNFTNGVETVDPCYDMKNCYITTKKTDDGSMDEEAVQGKWVRVKCVSKGETDFTPVGAHLDGATWTEDAHPIGCGDAIVGVNNISGAANDGSETGTGKNNIATISAKLNSANTASPTPGLHSFKMRVIYTYGTGV